MPRTKRERFDWMPGPAALQAIDIATELLPKARQQALIDRLVIIGAAALAAQHWKPPSFYGSDRDRWALPPELKALLPEDQP